MALQQSPAYRRSRGATRAPLAALAFSLAISLVGGRPTSAADPPAAEPSVMPGSVAMPASLDLAACLNLALQHQPRIAAARASLAAAEDGKRALDALHIPPILDPEIPVRRRQACLGVTAAAAGLEQAEHDAVYAVTRTYFTVVYAREQERVARGVVDRLSAINEVARGALQSGARNVTSTDVNRTTVYLRLAQTQQVKAAQGVKRATIALREAIGFGPEFHFDVAAGRLPQLDVRLSEDDIVASALSRRGEMAQAGIFAEETCLEVEAQSTTIQRRKETFASGSDIHARAVPSGEHNDDYRPGGIIPEMPTLLVGNRPERVKHARALNARAEALVEGTRNLIALEAEDAFLRWEEASQEVVAARDAAESGELMANDLSKDFTSGLKVRVEDVVNARVLGSQAQSRYNEYLYRQILALADIERITAGGVCAGLVELAATRGQSGTTPGTGAR
jgi:outer membrane protein TolC